jgi:hypothetical protein
MHRNATAVYMDFCHVLRFGQGNGLHIRHLLQLPATFSFSEHLHSLCCFVMKQLAFLQVVEQTSALPADTAHGRDLSESCMYRVPVP